MKYISHGTKFNTIENHVNAPLFKRVFDCENTTNAKLTITVVGLYRLWLNGKELNKSMFAPYLSNPDQAVFSDTYDLQGMLKPTNNVLCVLLGNGFANSNDFDVWNNQTAPYRCAPKFALSLTSSGKTIVESDENFAACDSPITFDDFRCGERYDARLEKKDVLTSTSLDGFVSATVVEPPKGEIFANNVQPIVAGRPKQAVSITKTSDGYLYDFGANGTGVCMLSLAAAKNGQQIDMYHGEVLDKNNHVDLRNISFEQTNPEYNQHDVYVCKDGAQTYMPCFTWHGFRYCEVKGLTAQQATLETVQFVSTRSDLPQVASFVCDNDTVNKIVDITLQSDKSNFVYYPYDCPQREKNGWTADASLSAEQMLYNFDAKQSLEQWLVQIRKAQRADGALPGIVPTAGWGFNWGNGPAWDSVLVELPFQLLRFYGDEHVVTDNASAITKYFDYAATKLNEEGLASFGLGDWCQTYAPWGHVYETPLEVTDTLTLVDMANKTTSMFRKVGLSADKIADFAKKLTLNFRTKYIRDGKLAAQTQTALAMALRTGVLFEEESKVAYTDLLALIAAQNDHFRVGVVGYKYLFETLVEHGDIELCFTLITQKSFPSYGYIVEQGATTLWESFDQYVYGDDGKIIHKDGSSRMSSFNHHFWGGVLAWIYRYIGGLDVVDSENIKIAIVPVNGVNAAKTTYARNGKSVAVDWIRDGKSVKIAADVNGFNCILCMPSGETVPMKDGKQTIKVPVK